MRVFLSYSSHDCEFVNKITTLLESRGISIWRDQDQIHGGQNYGPEIVQAIKDADVLLLCCSRNSVSSHNVRQEIQIAWTWRTPCLPVLLDGIADYAQLEYWLAGLQYVDLTAYGGSDAWLPHVLAGLRAVKARSEGSASAIREGAQAIDELMTLARFSDTFWPEPFADVRPTKRDLGAAPKGSAHRFRRGERIRLHHDVERAGYVLVLDIGTSGIIYCLCPSRFAPETAVAPGMTAIPQPGSPFPYLEVSGATGHEKLLAIVSDTKPPFDLSPPPDQVALRLDQAACQRLVEWLRQMPAASWKALATEFEILP